ncbi:competence/damage-inducible protein A [Paenibacillus sp. JX-17]|uniref:Putative competence-damage inducible protein n=1 Tax=Paenibacillus lacisoli TaxID=3064525 RepID=A0ABT9C927_9BACL|nr:competence/damage-inducible protein A [Paenibacillus sp. JX-17]MDO7905760.1 competence/damage-inducible protein A [Paenibacillus sp. JX-17]
MKAEIIAVGTELLLGQIVNTNAQFLSQELAALGIDVYFQTVVGDNITRLEEAIRIAQGRADVILFSGGLGPTQDDLTKEVLASVLGTELHIDRMAMDKIEQFFLSRGAEMTENNRRQALSLKGSTPLENETGLAVGDAIAQDGKFYVVLPGPPKELKPMFHNQAKPWLLQQALTDEQPIYSKMLKFAGIGESALETRLLDLIESQSDPTIAPYAKEGEVTIRISTKASSQTEAMTKLNAMELQIQQRLPQHLYASEDIPLEKKLVDMMVARQLTVSAAESCTGGLLMESLTSVPGSATVLLGGVVCYTNEIKKKLLHVPASLLEGDNSPGAVSEEVARALAENVRLITDSDFGLSVTGVAGPGFAEGKPPGLVYIGIAERDRKTEVHELRLNGNRETVRLRAAKSIMYRLWRRLVDQETPSAE